MGNSLSANVQFGFYAPRKQSQTEQGTVTRDGNRMTLWVPLQSQDPYVIIGEGDRIYVGRHVGLPGDTEVIARWVLLGSTYVGTWEEDGERWFFSFEDPESSSVSPAQV